MCVYVVMSYWRCVDYVLVSRVCVTGMYRTYQMQPHHVISVKEDMLQRGRCPAPNLSVAPSPP